MNKLNNYHPFTAFLFFVSMLTLTMFSIEPVLITISFLAAVTLCFLLFPLKEMMKSLCFSFVFITIISLTNPLFVHKGVTELFFLNNQAITLEALIYGVVIAFMLSAVFYWFKAYNYVISTDKFIYLFKFLPKFALMLSMSTAFLPKLKKNYREIAESQKAMGLFCGDGFVDKVKNRLRIASILFACSIEGGIETADSMEARGYGLKNRTSFGFYKWKKSDTFYLLFIVAVLVGIVALLAAGYGSFSFYPTFTWFSGSAQKAVLSGLTALYAFSPMIIETKENLLWRYLQSKI